MWHQHQILWRTQRYGCQFIAIWRSHILWKSAYHISIRYPITLSFSTNAYLWICGNMWSMQRFAFSAYLSHVSRHANTYFSLHCSCVSIYAASCHIDANILSTHICSTYAAYIRDLSKYAAYARIFGTYVTYFYHIFWQILHLFPHFFTYWRNISVEKNPSINWHPYKVSLAHTTSLYRHMANTAANT